MQFTLTISQTKALEWGLNAQQAILFSFVYGCPSWARPINTEGGVFYALSKRKITEELPLLTDKPDTAYRLLKQLERAGVIQLSHTSGITLVRLTDRGRTWNRAVDGSEKYPGGVQVGKISEQPRKNIRGGSEKSPTNQDTSNQDTNQRELTRRDLLLSNQLLDWAAEHAPLADLAHETKIFQAHPGGAGRSYHDQSALQAHWKTWILRGQRWAQKSQNPGPAAGPAAPDFSDRSWASDMGDL